jgi:voltage-gated potassium channel Kch
VIVFFITLGANLSLHHIGSMLAVIVVSVLIAAVAKPLVAMVVMGYLGYTKRTSFKTSVALAQVSEFSIVLVLLGEKRGLIGANLVTAITFVALASIAASSYLIIFSDKIFNVLEKYLGLFERRQTHGEAVARRAYELILFGYQKGGQEFVQLFKQMKQSYLVVDYDPEVIDVLEHHKINHLYGDVTDMELLEEAGVAKAKLIVCTITDFDSSSFLLQYLERKNSQAVVIVEAESPKQATELYERGASYVTLPHYIGSEQISAFVRKSGLQKSAFKKERTKHLRALERQLRQMEKGNEQEKKLGQAIIEGVASLTKAKP